MAWIAIDFDHTIRDNDNDRVMPGAREALSKLHELGHKIMIHSCNGTGFIKKWMRENNIYFDAIWGESPADLQKPVCTVYIDDRAVGFRGDWAVSIKETLDIVATKKNY